MHTLLIVAAGTDSGIPAMRAPIRVTFIASVGFKQHPNRTSSIISGDIPARSTAAFIGTLAIFAACISRKVPPNAPIAVRQADTITTSVIWNSFYVGYERTTGHPGFMRRNGRGPGNPATLLDNCSLIHRQFLLEILPEFILGFSPV
jgi:hypothetical protein